MKITAQKKVMSDLCSNPMTIYEKTNNSRDTGKDGREESPRKKKH